MGYTTPYEECSARADVPGSGRGRIAGRGGRAVGGEVPVERSEKQGMGHQNTRTAGKGGRADCQEGPV